MVLFQLLNITVSKCFTLYFSKLVFESQQQLNSAWINHFKFLFMILKHIKTCIMLLSYGDLVSISTPLYIDIFR